MFYTPFCEVEKPAFLSGKLIQNPLEDKLQRQLQDARVVRRRRAEQCIGRATRIWSCSSIASNLIRASTRTIGVRGSRTGIAAQPIVFKMVEHIERLSPEFKILALCDRETLEQRHVEVRPPGIV